MKQQSTLDRHLNLIRTLSLHDVGATVCELAELAKVSDKTIRRDLLLLRRVGCPLTETHGENNLKRWKLCSDRVLPAALRWDEAAALYVGRKLMQPLAGTQLEGAFQSLAKKIELALSDDARQYLDRLAETLLITSGPETNYAGHSEFLDALQFAVDERRLTWLTYQSQASTEPVTNDVHPYGIAYVRGSVYLVAFAPHHGEVRNYKLDRVSGVDVQVLKFPKPTGFSLKQHLAGTWGIYRGNATEPISVSIRFAASVARYVQEKRWHASQQLSVQTDGSLIAEYQLQALEELQAWVLSFGHKAEVLAPESLRETIREEILQLANVYSIAPAAERRRSPKQPK